MKNQKLFTAKLTSLVLVTVTASLGLSHWALAADPFRAENARELGENTEKAFETIFLLGDYQGAKEPLQLAEQENTTEPLAYALLASLAFTEKDWDTLRVYALKTLEMAEKLKTTDPLRSNLYLAVGHFMDGAYLYEKEGAVSAIQKLQLVFKYFDAAEDVNPNDPELNLIKGYVDLLLAVNLPFSSPEQAIARFEQFAAPDYLVDRGIAVAYRDLKDYEKALVSVNQALELAPENPEHYYLKGQILRKIGKKKQDITVLTEALDNFSQAVSKEAQLPSFIVEPLKREMRQTQETIEEIKAISSKP
jgi:tetratricopeptide (TPR) repeat protein